MSQEGYIGMWDKETGRTEFIRPQHPDGVNLRYSWNAALALDPTSDVGLYFGSQFVHHSADGGHSWDIISPDLTTNDTLKQDQSKSGGLTLDITGAENHTTILCISPSPHDSDVIFVGTDDGNLQVTRNGGESWNNINSRLPGLPKNAWIPQVEISKTNKGEIFVVVNNYRMNDWSAHLYHSKDNGVTWRRIVDDNDVGGFVCSVVQDTKNEDLIFLGTDVGLYFSLDRGGSWVKWEKGLPSVQVRDMKIQEDFDDLVLGTFGRSFWVLDDIEPLRELARSGIKSLNEDFKVFDPGTAYLTSSRSYQGVRFIGQGDFQGDNKPRGAVVTVWNKPKDKKENEEGLAEISEIKKKKGKKKALKEKMTKEDKKEDKKLKGEKKKGKDKMTVMVIDNAGDTIRTFKRKLKEGMNRVRWFPDAKGVAFPRKEEAKEKSEPGGMPIIPGTYKLVMEYGKHKDSTNLIVELDPRIEKTKLNPKAKYKAMKSFNNTVEKVTTAYDNLKEAKKSLGLYEKIIEVQPDTVKKEYTKLNKEISSNIDSLMNLYMLPKPVKTQYEDDSHTLMTKLWNARRFLGSSNGAPTPNGQNAIKNADRKSEEILEGVNAFFSKDWKEYIEKIKALPLDIFKEYEEVRF